MSWLGGGDWTGAGSADPGSRAEQVQLRRRQGHEGVVATGTIACSRCDAPVAIGPGEVRIGDRLSCPFCDHRGPVREFLSLAVPTRPTRVQVRLRVRRG